MARGGKKRDTTPRDPAPVSGPGALSRRTDGGPSQPIRTPTGLPYGDRQALEESQRAAPLPAETGGMPGGGGRQGRPSVPPPRAAFGPTARPFESPTAGLAGQNQIIPDDPDELLKILYGIHPHPDLARLLNPYQGA